MYIKSMVIDGFKSYGRRTEIVGFDDKFNAITGLNGSGKSNILEAICFVLGITNLSKVRVDGLQELIYKAGQCGINKATVSVTFDNRDPQQCPPGFDGVNDIVITRQIMMGGTSKYMINGHTVPNKRVHDLFCSVQLNVNKPHFLIMQGQITKVLSMKPKEILGMVEEAAGTGMYEQQRDNTTNTIQKKEGKLQESRKRLDDDISKKIDKLRDERAEYLKFETVERNLKHLTQKFLAWEYVSTERLALKCDEAIESEKMNITNLENEISNHKTEITNLEKFVAEVRQKAELENKDHLSSLEKELKSHGTSHAKVKATLSLLSGDITNETKKKQELEKNLKDDTALLKTKQAALEKIQGNFLKLKKDDEEDEKLYAQAQKRFEALSAGKELTEEGRAATLRELLVEAREELSKWSTERQQSDIRLKFCQDLLSKKQSKRLSESGNANQQKKQRAELKAGIEILEERVKKLGFDAGKLEELVKERRRLVEGSEGARERVERWKTRYAHAHFQYKEPEGGWRKERVWGVACSLFQIKDDEASLALETAAGGKLFNVVVDTESTSKLLLEKGDLQRRTTFIPINKIKGGTIPSGVVKIAQNLEGDANVQPALDFITYDKRLQVVMEYIFGNVLICKDHKIATRLAFDKRIKRKCVTLDGDVIDPSGVLSGGSRPEGVPFLQQFQEIQALENELEGKGRNIQKCEARFNEMKQNQKEYLNLCKEIQIKEKDLELVECALQSSTQYQQEKEINNLTEEIEQLQVKIKECKEKEKEYTGKVNELEKKVNSKGDKEKQLKESEQEMLKLKEKSNKSKKQWQQREHEFQTYNLEISEIEAGLENTQKQIKETEEAVKALEAQKNDIIHNSKDLTDNIARLEEELEKEKLKITESNKEVQKKLKNKDKLQDKITSCEVKIKEYKFSLNKLQEESKHLKAKAIDCRKRTNDTLITSIKQMTDEEGKGLEKQIRVAQEKTKSMRTLINPQALMNFEEMEREFEELKKKQRTVEDDKTKLLRSIETLDEVKVEMLRAAYKQISRDFGSIFGTLLPGGNAKLVAIFNNSVLQGLEIKVSLGADWKDSLTELSGGQRSLAALSLVLAMLLFKPAPLYILDEVDAALDLSHTQNIGKMLKTHFSKAQFIVVSLKDGMFENANVLFKTLFVDGVSTVNRTANQKAC